MSHSTLTTMGRPGYEVSLIKATLFDIISHLSFRVLLGARLTAETHGWE